MLKHTRFNTVLSSDFSLKCLKSLLLRIGIVMICEFTRDQKWVQETYMLKSNSITRTRISLTLGLIVLGSTQLWSTSLTHLLLENGLLAVAASSIISRNGRSRKKVSNHYDVFSVFFIRKCLVYDFIQSPSKVEQEGIFQHSLSLQEMTISESNWAKMRYEYFLTLIF